MHFTKKKKNQLQLLHKGKLQSYGLWQIFLHYKERMELNAEKSD